MNFIAIDTGTTNTRVWLCAGGAVVARATAMIGVRDTARTGSPAPLHDGLRTLIAEVRAQQPHIEPECVAAAGMITSPLGLAAVPHVSAPAGLNELRHHAQCAHFPALCELPFVLFPGVRTGALTPADQEVLHTNPTAHAEIACGADVMRGEETLCVGLFASALAAPPFTLFNLGSHWKAIAVNAQGQVQASRTSLSGELIFATQTETILASALPAGKLDELATDWLERGMAEFTQAGLARALFCVRLLELQAATTPAQRMAFLLGVYLAAELAHLRDTTFFADTQTILLSGSGAVATAWHHVLQQHGFSRTSLLSNLQIENAFLAGIAALLNNQCPA